MRWLYHVVPRGHREPQRGDEGFVHCSFRDTVEESARLYMPGGDILRIDPRRVTGLVVADTPRGPMPHVHGTIASDAVAGVNDVELDRVEGTRVAFVGFAGMTLLDLVGPHDVVRRCPSVTCEIVSAHGLEPWSGGGARYLVERERPPLDDFDLVVVAGGVPARELCKDERITTWLASYTRRIASVCTGALLLGAAGRLRGKRATTHASALHLLAAYGATAVTERIVDEDDVVTAGGVTAGIDLGLHLATWLEDDVTAATIAAQIEWR